MQRYYRETRDRWQRTAAVIPPRFQPFFQANDETAEDVFRDSISPVVQAQCVNCHVAGGVSGATRIVFVRSSNTDHEAVNRQTFEDFLAAVDGGANVILNKIRGVGHGGGIQVPNGSQDYDHFVRFLTLLGGLGGDDDSQEPLTSSTLFDGLGMAPDRKTLRRAALIFAGRVPSAAEYAVLAEVDLRTAVRNLMAGHGFHQFLIRASNDRLLTDREDGVVQYDDNGAYVAYTNKSNAFCQAAAAGGDQTAWHEWEDAVQYASVRAPLELIAHVAENDLPYTDILTADYIMANPQAAEAYGATTEFDDPSDVHAFKPSEFASYYRVDDSRIVEEPQADTDCQGTIIDAGNLETDYPHAGILNSPVFTVRYPTTATNRNRARSRWTYYHFLGLDVEKSASRTTDPDALADTNNPTLNNPACTVCHTILDPIGGTFQNYDEEGRYRSAWGGGDSLDDFYKDNPPGGDDFLIEAREWDERELVHTEGRFLAGENSIGLKVVNERDWTTMGLDTLTIRNSADRVVERYKIAALPALRHAHCGGPSGDGYYEIWPNCVLAVPVTVPRSGNYKVEVDAWIWDDGIRYPLRLRIWAPGYVYHTGDTWYLGMRVPGFGTQVAPGPDNSIQWLAEQIAADERFAEAAVKFWWPAIYGSDVVAPPEEAGDADFEGKLLAANAQATVPAQHLWHWGLGSLHGDKVLARCLIGERCVRTLVVEEELETGKGGSDARHGQRTVVEAPELDPRRAVCPLHATVPLGPARRQDMQWDALFLAGILERGHELAAAVDLHGQQRERQCAEEVHQEAFGIAGGGARVDPRHHELRDRADGPELLQRLPAIGVGHVVDLHEFPRPAGLGAVLPPRRPLREAAPPLGLDASLAERRGADRAGRQGAFDDPPDRRHAQVSPLARQHGVDARLAHERVLAAHVHHRLDVPGLVRPLTDTVRTGRLRRQSALAARGQRGLPPVPRPAADPELVQRASLAALRSAQLLVRLQRPVALGRLLGHVFVRRDTAVRSHSHGLYVHGSGLLPVGLRLLEATRSGAGDGLVPCPASPSRSWPIPCQMCLS